MVKEARRGLAAAEDELSYTVIRAPFPGVVVKCYRHLGDFASAGSPVLSMYNPELMYVTANLEETRLPGVAPGNPVTLHVDAFPRPFRGRVVWINKSTGAQFALMPRNVVSGEFTKVVQRVPVRIWIEKDDRWPQLQAGLSVRAVIDHGPGDPEWAKKAAQEFADLEGRYSGPQEQRVGSIILMRSHLRGAEMLATKKLLTVADMCRFVESKLGTTSTRALPGAFLSQSASPATPPIQRAGRDNPAVAGGRGHRAHLGDGLPDVRPDGRDRRRDPQRPRSRTLQHDLAPNPLGDRIVVRGVHRHLGLASIWRPQHAVGRTWLVRRGQRAVRRRPGRFRHDGRQVGGRHRQRHGDRDLSIPASSASSTAWPSWLSVSTASLLTRPVPRLRS